MQHVTHESKSIFIIKLHLPKLLSNVKGYTFLRHSVQRQKTVVFAAEYQLKRVTVAILNCASFHSLCCVMNRKVNILNSVSIGIIKCFAVPVSKVTACVRVLVFRHWHRSTIVLPVVYCPVDDTMFEMSPEVRCSYVSSHYCCYGNHTAGSKPT